jgi:hypothetical protein
MVFCFGNAGRADHLELFWDAYRLLAGHVLVTPGYCPGEPGSSGMSRSNSLRAVWQVVCADQCVSVWWAPGSQVRGN